MDDVRLISRLLDGDPRTVDRIRTWIRAASRPYQARLGSEIEDLEQEILLDVTRALRAGRFEGKSRLKTYVRTIVHHKSIDRLRQQRRRQWLDVEELELPSGDLSPLDEATRSQDTALGLHVLEQMPDSCRELWSMLEQGMRYREMSRRLGVGEGALRARVLRCRRRALELRARMLESKSDEKDA